MMAGVGIARDGGRLEVHIAPIGERVPRMVPRLLQRPRRLDDCSQALGTRVTWSGSCGAAGACVASASRLRRIQHTHV